MTPLQSLVLWAGVTLELVGIGLAVVDTLQVRRAFRERFGRVHLRGAGDFTATADVVHADDGREPTIEERVAQLERGLGEAREEIHQQVTALHAAMRQEIRVEAESIRGDLNFHVQDLRRLLGTAVEPNRQRTLGFGLFAVGLLFQTAANYVR